MLSATRGTVWCHGELPLRPECDGFELRLHNEGTLRADEVQLGALMRFLQAHYKVEFAEQEAGVDTSPGRFAALLSALLAKAHRLECGGPDVMPVGGRVEGTIDFFVVPVEVMRFTREQVLALPLIASDPRGGELRGVGADARLTYVPDENVATVERMRDGEWVRIDLYNPVRSS